TLIGAGSFSQGYYLIDAATGKVKHSLGQLPTGRETIAVHETNEVRPIALSADGKTLAAPLRTESQTVLPDGLTTQYHSPKQWVCWYDPSSGKQVGETKLEETWQHPRFVALAGDGKTFACVGANESIVVWDRPSGKRLHRLAGHPKEALCGAFSC